MKKRIVLLGCFLVMIWLGGCTAKPEEGEGGDSFPDRPDSGLSYELTNIASGGASLFWETEDRYYMVYTPKETTDMISPLEIQKDLSYIGKRLEGTKKIGGYLYSTKKDVLDWQPVCTSTRCRHDGEYCMALLNKSAVSFGIYDEHIYFTSLEIVSIYVIYSS